jgi:hypothetical protein
MLRHLPEIFFLIACGSCTLTLGFVVLFVRARERAIRAESILAGMQYGRGPQQHSVLEPAIDAIATEIERIGENQRFLTKVMTEKGGAVPTRRDYGTVTPH